MGEEAEIVLAELSFLLSPLLWKKQERNFFSFFIFAFGLIFSPQYMHPFIDIINLESDIINLYTNDI